MLESMTPTTTDRTVRTVIRYTHLPVSYTHLDVYKRQINAGSMRHYFFDMGAGNTIAFFCWSDAEVPTFEKPAGIPPDFPAQFDHVSFNLPERRDLFDLQARLREHGVEVTELVDHGFVQSIYLSLIHI